VELSLVVAMSRTGLIGQGGALPWHLPRDLRDFRKLTWGKPIIMGRKTHEGLGRPLPGRTNIILTRQSDFRAEGCLLAYSREQAIAHAQATGCTEAMIIGGAEIYREFLPDCGTIHLTLVEGEFVGDTYFPEPILDSPGWMRISEEFWEADPRNPQDARSIVLKRK
jgi:dihydrofolate reductase